MSIRKNTPNFLKISKLPFTTVLNEIINMIQDPGALGIYVYLSSKPESWEINQKQLMNHFKIGKDSCNKKMKYLKELGLLKVTSIRNSKGIIIAWQTELINQITENPDSGQNPSPQRTNADCEKHICTECKQTVDTRMLEIQILGNPESGKTAPINKRGKEIKECECVCADAHPEHTHIFSEKTKALFEDKFGRYEVTIESLFHECMQYYEGKRKVTDDIFARWIKMESLDNFVLKNTRPTVTPVNTTELEEASIAKANQKAKAFKNVSREESIQMLKKFSQKTTAKPEDAPIRFSDFGAISIHEVR